MSVKKERYIAIDILRGLSVMFMIFVNNPVSWDYLYPWMDHAPWVGFNIADFVYPTFIFCMGFSMCISLKKFDSFSAGFVKKIVHRFLSLAAIAYVVGILTKTLPSLYAGMPLGEALLKTFANLRIMGVFVRLGLCFLFGGFIIQICKKKKNVILMVAVVILAGYAIFLMLGNGYELAESNLLIRFDNLVIPSAHLYPIAVGDSGLFFDPEGILSTLPAIAQLLIGYAMADSLLAQKEKTERILKSFTVGVGLFVFGWLLNPFIPICKNVWSVSYVLFSCGIDLFLLGFFEAILSKENCGFAKKAFDAIRVFGETPLKAYMLSTGIYVFFAFIHIRPAGDPCTILGFVRQGLFALCPDHKEFASFLYAVLFVILNWSILKIWKKCKKEKTPNSN